MINVIFRTYTLGRRRRRGWMKLEHLLKMQQHRFLRRRPKRHLFNTESTMNYEKAYTLTLNKMANEYRPDMKL